MLPWRKTFFSLFAKDRQATKKAGAKIEGEIPIPTENAADIICSFSLVENQGKVTRSPHLKTQNASSQHKNKNLNIKGHGTTTDSAALCLDLLTPNT